MLTQPELFVAARNGYKVFVIYRSLYYRNNGKISFPKEMKYPIQDALIIKNSTDVVVNFISDNKDAKDFKEINERIDNNLEQLRVKMEIGIKYDIRKFQEASELEQKLINRNGLQTKQLVIFIGRNVQPELLKKKEYMENMEAGQAKKFIAVNLVVRNLLDENRDKSAEELIDYVNENIKKLVEKSILLWDKTIEFGKSGLVQKKL